MRLVASFTCVSLTASLLAGCRRGDEDPAAGTLRSSAPASASAVPLASGAPALVSTEPASSAIPTPSASVSAIARTRPKQHRADPNPNNRREIRDPQGRGVVVIEDYR